MLMAVVMTTGEQGRWCCRCRRRWLFPPDRIRVVSPIRRRKEKKVQLQASGIRAQARCSMLDAKCSGTAPPGSKGDLPGLLLVDVSKEGIENGQLPEDLVHSRHMPSKTLDTLFCEPLASSLSSV